MGVKLGKVIQGINTLDLNFNGSTVAIDALNTLMVFLKRKYQRKFYQNSYNKLEYTIDKTQRAISHLYGIFYRNIKLLECGMIPIYCFDGKPDRLKRLILSNEFRIFLNMKSKYEKAINSNNYNKAKIIALSKEFIWENAIQEMKNLLLHMGIPYLNSPSEGEAQCAQLVKMGICDYTISTDFDALIFGSKNLLKISKFRGKKIEGVLYTAQSVLNHLGLNRFQLVDLSILIGSDYFPGVKGIGPKSSIKLLNRFGTLDNILSQVGSKDLQVNLVKSELNLQVVNKIRKLFVMPEVLSKIPKKSLSYPKRGGIINLMCIDHNLNKSRIEKGTNRLIKSFNRIQK